MLLLLGIIKKNDKYYMNVVNTEEKITDDNYQLVNQYILNQCENVRTNHFLSGRQNPLEYLRGDFDVSRLIIDSGDLRNKIKDFQIITVYEDDNKKPILYSSIDRAGKISIHDISEFEYVKNGSILGSSIDNLPSFVSHEPVVNAKKYLEEFIKDDELSDLPVGLAKIYLMLVKNFKEGYETVTKIDTGIEFDIRESMLFNGASTIKLSEYISENKDFFLTKQDELSNPFPKERTVGFSSNPLVVLGIKRILPNVFNKSVPYEYEFYNLKSIKVSIPFWECGFSLYDKHVKGKELLQVWPLDFNNNLSIDIYKNILPKELVNLPHLFYKDMKITPFAINRFQNLANDNIYVETWIYTVALLMCWQFYSDFFKKRIKRIIEDYQNIYNVALSNLVKDIGPESTLIVMKWMKAHLKEALSNIYGSTTACVDEYNCLFTFHQNDYDLDENIRVYSSDTILKYGGVDKLKRDYETPYIERKKFIIRELEKIEKTLQDNNNIKVEQNLENALKELKKKI